MAGRESAALAAALKLMEQGVNAFAAANQSGIAPATIYRALKRRRLAQAAMKAKRPRRPARQSGVAS